MRKSTLFSINVMKMARNNNNIDANLLVEIPKTESIYIISLYNNLSILRC